MKSLYITSNMKNLIQEVAFYLGLTAMILVAGSANAQEVPKWLRGTWEGEIPGSGNPLP
jgi:hypothetical protein